MKEKYITDTSVIISELVSDLVRRKKIKGKILVHRAVIAELENQANRGKEIGFIGLGEIKRLREIAKQGKIKLEYVGDRPSAAQIRRARVGEIDAMIRDYAYEQDACLVTSDLVQAEAAKAMGIEVIYIEPKKKRALGLEKFFDTETMSVHLKEKVLPYAKKGRPGKWVFVPLAKDVLKREEIQEIAREIIEAARAADDGFIEVERRGSTIVQLRNYRIIITRPPFSDGWEITATRPVAKLEIEDYYLDEKLIERLERRAEGILIAGAPGMGKTTFAQALAEFYQKKGKIVKTVEAPRDLVLPDEITQYSKHLGTKEEIHDILLLARPDYTIFDEMRSTEDFKLYADMRLAGVGMIGVVHATSPIDAIQRFVGRVELGMIPSILDTVIWMKEGEVKKVHGLRMRVKVPTGMKEADLARPVIEVRDFLTRELEYEMYTFGEQTIVVSVKRIREQPALRFLKESLRKNLRRYARGRVEIEIPSEREAIVYLSSKDIPKVIGRDGKRIANLERRMGIRIEVRDIAELVGKEVEFLLEEEKERLNFFFEKDLSGKRVEFYAKGEPIFSTTIGRKGKVSISKKSDVGKKIEESRDEIKVVIA